MRTCWVGSLALVCGCFFELPNETSPSADAPAVDAMPDAAAACEPWTTRGGHVAAPCDTPPAAPWSVGAGGGTFDTSDGSYVGDGTVPAGALVDQGMGYKFRLVSVESFSLANGATLRVVGQYPLMILSWSDMNVAGTIDVSSKRVGATADRGAGSGRVGCTAAVAGLGQQDGGGGGGGSGGFIGLDAPTVTVLSGGIVAANGGGAGVGCNAGPGETGENGEDGKLSTTNAAGGQGNSCTNGNRGGAGGNLASPAGGAGTSATSGGGGGGGGGVGYIIVWTGTFTESGTLSPMTTRR